MKILEQRDVGTCKKTVKIEIPPDEVGTELDELYKEFIENAIVPGFRKGKAPRRIVKMKYGKHLDSEAVEKAVETAFKKAMEELDLTPVDSPQFSEIDKEKTEEPVVFEATFEYAPRLESVNYRDIRPEVPP
ncbi:MAG TPA: trigger factor family protein, partial [bacterium]|nr:trigger factor family protein [bacterium]